MARRKKPVAQLCKLCLQSDDLILSHFMPGGLYPYCRTKDSDPVRVTADVIMQTGWETKDYLLCYPCDNSLNTNGEGWVIPRLCTQDGSFPLYEMLLTQKPDVAEADVTGYAGARYKDLAIRKLAHFALGIFWKASVHSWVKHSKDSRIDLGPFGEPLRKFLRGESNFPEHMTLLVGIVPPDKKITTFIEPYRGSAEGYHNYVCYVPGVQFVLSVGKMIPKADRECCFVGNPLHPMTIVDLYDRLKEIYQEQTAKAHRAAKLLNYWEEKKKKVLL